MKTALSITANRLAPLFDVACHLLIVEWQDGQECSRREHHFEGSALSRLAELKRLGVDQLVCGAISRPLQHAALAMGIEIFGFLTGEQDVVLGALMKGELHRGDMAMPGCRLGRPGCGQGRHRGHLGKNIAKRRKESSS
jgi:hypothetical protein